MSTAVATAELPPRMGTTGDEDGDSNSSSNSRRSRSSSSGGADNGSYIPEAVSGSHGSGAVGVDTVVTAAATTSRTTPYIMKINKNLDLSGLSALRAAFPQQLRAAVTSGQPQDAVLYVSPAGADAAAPAAAESASSMELRAMPCKVAVQSWLYRTAVVCRLTRTAPAVRRLGLRPGDRVQLRMLQDGRVLMMAAGGGGASEDDGNGGGGANDGAAASYDSPAVPCVVHLLQSHFRNRMYIPLDVVRQLLGAGEASRLNQMVPVLLEWGEDGSSPAATPATTPAERQIRRGRRVQACYLRSYRYLANRNQAPIWYLRGARSWLRALGAAPGDALQLELTKGPKGPKVPESEVAAAAADAAGGGGCCGDGGADSPEPVVRIRLVRGCHGAAGIEALGSLRSWARQRALAAAEDDGGRGAGDDGAAAGGGEATGPAMARRRGGAAGAAIGDAEAEALAAAAVAVASSGARVSYWLRVRCDGNFTGRRAIRNAFPQQLLRALSRRFSGSSNTSSGESSSGSSTSSTSGGVGSSRIPEVQVYGLVPAAAGCTARLKEYTLGLYAGPQGLDSLALTRTAALSRDLRLHPGDRARLWVLPDGRIVVAPGSGGGGAAAASTRDGAAADANGDRGSGSGSGSGSSAAGGPSAAVRLTQTSLKVHVCVSNEVIRQLLGSEAAGRGGQVLAVQLQRSSSAAAGSGDVTAAEAVAARPARLRSFPPTGTRVAPYWYLSGATAWLTEQGAAPGDILRLSVAGSGTASSPTGTDSATTLLEKEGGHHRQPRQQQQQQQEDEEQESGSDATAVNMDGSPFVICARLEHAAAATAAADAEQLLQLLGARPGAAAAAAAAASAVAADSLTADGEAASAARTSQPAPTRGSVLARSAATLTAMAPTAALTAGTRRSALQSGAGHMGLSWPRVWTPRVGPRVLVARPHGFALRG